MQIHPSYLNNLRTAFNLRNRNNDLQQVDSILPNRVLFQSYDILIQHNKNLETSVECIGHLYNQSCLFKNLYYTESSFLILTTKKFAFPLPDVRIGAFIISQFNPNRRLFYSYTDLEDFVKHNINPIVIPNTTVYFDQPWLSNIGHALFDGLYPAYVALIRFQPKHLQPFRILLSTFNDGGDSSFSQDVYNVFAGLGTMNVSVLQHGSAGRWFAFQELVMGSGNMCQRCLQPNLQLPGGIELNGSRLFRDRMYKQHGLTTPTKKYNHSAEGRNPQRPLRAYIIDNKRFTKQDILEIHAAIDEINRRTDNYEEKTRENRTDLHWPLVQVYYMNYALASGRNDDESLQLSSSRIQSKTLVVSDKMMAHLELLQDMDIHITGPGTGQMYQTFLSDGSVHINLGGLRHRKESVKIKNYTSFLEQYMTAGTPYIKGLYYPINERPFGIKKETLIKLIKEAALLILDGFRIPVNPKDNLASDGQLFIEMCTLDKEFCMAVTERSQYNNFLCIDTWPEDIVHENGPWSVEGIYDGEKKVICPYNRTLFNWLKRKYNID